MTVSYDQTIGVGGITAKVSESNSDANEIKVRRNLAAAKTGTLTLRTDDNTGSLTMATGHGITTGALLDVYWVGGSRRGMTVGVVAGDVVPIDGGAGDNLPDADAAITAMVPVTAEARFDGDDVLAIVFSAPAKATMVLTGDDDVEDYAIVLSEAGASGWSGESAVANPVAGDTITKCRISHGDSGGSKALQVGIGYD